MGWTGSLGLVDANYYIYMDKQLGPTIYTTENYTQFLGIDHDGRQYEN